jgi:flagellar biosynthesis protein FlhB
MKKKSQNSILSKAKISTSSIAVWITVVFYFIQIAVAVVDYFRNKYQYVQHVK